LKDDLLILDSTTGPGLSGLIIWDLKKRKKECEGSWSDPIFLDDSILYWLETEKATHDNCPELAEWESHGLGAAIETRVLLNLSNFSISKTKECGAAQDNKNSSPTIQWPKSFRRYPKFAFGYKTRLSCPKVCDYHFSIEANPFDR
jgi:hypothetical protein